MWIHRNSILHLCTKQVFEIQFVYFVFKWQKKKYGSDSTRKKIIHLFSRLLRLDSFFFRDTCTSKLTSVKKKYQSTFWAGFFKTNSYIVQLLITKKFQAFFYAHVCFQSLDISFGFWQKDRYTFMDLKDIVLNLIEFIISVWLIYLFVVHLLWHGIIMVESPKLTTSQVMVMKQSFGSCFLCICVLLHWFLVKLINIFF